MTTNFSWATSIPAPERHHDIARLMGGFETFDQAVQRRGDLIKKLKADKGDHDCRSLAKKLRKCRKDHRCGSGACPVCSRKFRRWLTGELLEFFGANKDQLWSATLVPHSLQRRPGELSGVSICKAMDQLRTQLRRAGLGDLVIIGGLDISYNEHQQKAWEQHWQPHFYLLFQAPDGHGFHDAIARFFPNHEAIKTSIHVERVKNSLSNRAKVTSYAWKSAIFRRLSTDKVHSKTRKALRPRLVSIRRNQKCELALWLDRYSPFDRLFLRNVRRRGWTLSKQKLPRDLSA